MQPTVEARNVSKTYQLWRTPASRLWAPAAQRLASGLKGIPAISTRLEHSGSRAVDNIHALKPVDLIVQPGESVGILGRNGSGKSTLLQIIAGTLPPTTGTVSVRGRVAVILQLGAGFHPQFSGRENVYLNAAVMGVPRKEVRSRIGEVIEFAGIGDFIDRPLKAYSSGMRMRLAFAVQIMLSPEVLIIDEALSVGDLFFQQRCAEHLKGLIDKGTSVLFVSHSMSAVQQFCDRAIVLDGGKCLYEGSAVQAVARYSQMGNATASAIQQTPGTENKPVAPTPIASQAVQHPIEWPEDKAFVSINTAINPDEIVGTGRVALNRIAICNQAGSQCSIFEQGQRALIACEYAVEGQLDRPSCGFSLRDKNAVKAHGMHMFQRPDEHGVSGPDIVPAGHTLRIIHEVELGLANGQYSIDIGVCTAPPSAWDGNRIPRDRIEDHLIRELEIFDCLQIEVIPRNEYAGYPLTHFGIANLPGQTTWDLMAQPATIISVGGNP